MLSWWMTGSETRRSSTVMSRLVAAASMRIQSRTPSELMNVTPARSSTSVPFCARASSLSSSDDSSIEPAEDELALAWRDGHAANG